MLRLDSLPGIHVRRISRPGKEEAVIMNTLRITRKQLLDWLDWGLFGLKMIGAVIVCTPIVIVSLILWLFIGGDYGHDRAQRRES